MKRSIYKNTDELPMFLTVWKNGHRASVLLLVPFIVYLLFQLFICFLWYSLAYGEWKN